MVGVAIEEFVGLKSKMFSILVSHVSGYQKSKGANAVTKISHNEYKDVLLKKKYLIHLINRIQSKNEKQELTKSIKFICLTLITKFIFLIMELIH